MKNLMQKLFGVRARSPKTGPGSPQDNPPTIQEGSENSIRQQLVQVLLRDLMRRHGIPPEWIEPQMMVVSSSRGPGLYVRLVIKHWDQRLINHAYALQSALLADIARFEPRASSWLHGLSWQLDFTGACPYPTLPDKSFWSEPEKPALVAALDAPPAPISQFFPVTPAVGLMPAAPGTEEDEARQDLERLFRIRDQELGKQSDGGQASPGFEKTQASPL